MHHSDSNVFVRRADGEEDASRLIALIESLAHFESLTPPDQAAQQRFVVDGFTRRPPRFEALLAGVDGEDPSGYAIYFYTYSTFLCRPTLYIEDIFVAPDRRRTGIARAMIAHLAQIAQDQGCGRMEWTCLDWNTGAQAVYQRIGARRLPEWYFYRLDEAGIEALAHDERRGGPEGADE